MIPTLEREATDRARDGASDRPSAASPPAMVIIENKPKHLEFIQRSIDRLENNSILLKGWTIILVATMLGLSLSNSGADGSGIPVYVICLPVLGFWLLDAHFQSQERQFRALHEYVRSVPEDDITYSMDTSVQKKDPRNGLLQSMFISSLILFYLPMEAIILFIGVLV